MELVESLGSGIPRIFRAYGEDFFNFTDRYMDKLDSILDEEIERHNQSLDDNERLD